MGEQIQDPITEEYWQEAAEGAYARYRVKARKYSLRTARMTLDEMVDHMSHVLQEPTWECIYHLILDQMDRIEDDARVLQVEAMGADQHYGDLEYKKILDGCLCAGCWNPLSVRKIPGGWEVYCVSCGTDRGFHSKYYAAKSRHRDKEWTEEATKRLEKWITIGGE